jgi:pimeloyl-ACP methyl ester carboxylesterase
VATTLDLDGLTVRYRRLGSGPQVLLLHGWGGSIESLEPVIQALVPHFDTTAIDFPGHGQSSLPPGPWRVSDFLRLTLQAMDRLGLARPHIVAHSFGARVSIQLASLHPDRAGKLLFTAGAGVAPRRTRKRRLKRAAASLARAVGIPAGLGARFGSRDYLNAGELRATLSLVVAEDLTPMLASIRSRCLLIWGDRDQETPLYMGETMRARIPDAELVVFPGAGHFPYLDEPNKFNLHALRFLRDP